MEFFRVKISEEAIKLTNEVLRSGWLNEGEYVRRFEKALSSYTGGPTLAISSCTAALHLALVSEHIGPGDEVIVPAQTFIATAMVVAQVGATPVFADIDPRTGNISPESIRAKITEHTAAIIPVHFGGLPCDMGEINAIADSYNLTVIEDAAHALGARYHDEPIGSLSDYTCFSFQCIKSLTCGDGGAITGFGLPNLRKRRWFGIDKENVKLEYNERIPSVDRVGFKYNMNNIAAAIGLGNLTEFPVRLKERRRIAAILREELNNVSGLQLMDAPFDIDSACWLFPVLVEDRKGFFTKMTENKIPVKVVNFGIDREPLFRRTQGQLESLPGQRYFDEHHICIPSHDGLTEEDIGLIVDTIKEGW